MQKQNLTNSNENEGDVFLKHKASVDNLLNKFNEDVGKIEDAVKTQIREIKNAYENQALL